jgi:multiple sugar transport system permease protein
MTAVLEPTWTRDASGGAPAQARTGRLRRTPWMATAVAWGYALLSFYPLLWIVSQSLRSDNDILARPYGVPVDPRVDGYLKAFEELPLPRYFLNSLMVTLAVVVLSVVCCAAAGYAFSQARFPGSRQLFAAYLGVLVIPAPVLLLPVFLISDDLGLLNSYIGLVAPYVAGTLPLGVYLMKTHFDALPAELPEAAAVDGATPWQVFRFVMFPLIRPGAATVAVLAFMAAWNEYIWALVSLSDADKYTLPVGLADLAAKQYLFGFAPVYAAMVLTTLPVLIAFVVAQRSFISSITAGAVKG